MHLELVIDHEIGGRPHPVQKTQSVVLQLCGLTNKTGRDNNVLLTSFCVISTQHKALNVQYLTENLLNKI